MKKFTMTVAVLLTVIGTAFASGDGSKETRVGIMPAKGDIYRVIYEVPEESFVTIKVTDSEGHVLRHDRVKSNGGFMKPYNFGKVKDGIYTIALSDKYGKITKDITIGDSKESKVAFNN